MNLSRLWQKMKICRCQDRVFAYENSCGDKGVIIASSYEKAVQIFYEKYPGRKIVDCIDDYYDDNGAFLFETGAVKKNALYNAFPW